VANGTTDTIPFSTSTGVATLDVPGLSAGSHSFSAELQNSTQSVVTAATGYDVTASTATLSLGPAATTTTLATAAGSAGGETLTATVAGPSGSTPAGTVAFKAGTTSLGTATLSGGKASVTDYSLPAGTTGFTATYTPSGSGFQGSSGTASITLPFAVSWVQIASPTISGTLKVGDALSVKGTFGPSGVALLYQWYANGVAISGGTGSTLTLSSGQYGREISVHVTGYKLGSVTEEAGSPSTAKIGTGAVTGTVPTISGGLAENDTLTAHAGTWHPAGVVLHYQWYYNSGIAISRATGTTYKIPASLAGKTIEVRVTGTDTDCTSLGLTSKATAKIAK
jgi:hypothetical protein